MDYINKLADKFNKLHISGRISKSDEIIEKAKTETNEIDDVYDKITFLRIVLEENEKEFQKHLPDCNEKNSCVINFARESISYYLNQELNRLGVKTKEDPFTLDEKEITETQLNNIINDIQTLKDGQKIIFDELIEMKELYFMGKKKWHQLLLGKLGEMVLSGLISDAVSKNIMSSFKLDKLLL